MTDEQETPFTEPDFSAEPPSRRDYLQLAQETVQYLNSHRNSTQEELQSDPVREALEKHQVLVRILHVAKRRLGNALIDPVINRKPPQDIIELNDDRTAKNGEIEGLCEDLRARGYTIDETTIPIPDLDAPRTIAETAKPRRRVKREALATAALLTLLVVIWFAFLRDVGQSRMRIAVAKPILAPAATAKPSSPSVAPAPAPQPSPVAAKPTNAPTKNSTATVRLSAEDRQILNEIRYGVRDADANINSAHATVGLGVTEGRQRSVKLETLTSQVAALKQTTPTQPTSRKGTSTAQRKRAVRPAACGGNFQASSDNTITKRNESAPWRDRNCNSLRPALYR